MTQFRPYKPPRLDIQPQLNTLALRQQVWGQGHQDVEWTQAAACPCRSKLTLTAGLETVAVRSGEARPDCASCRGRGWLYHSPSLIPAIITRMDSTPDRFAMYGLASKGMASVTMLPETVAGFMDRLKLTESVMPYSLVRARAASGVTDVFEYPIATRVLVEGSDGSPTTPTTTTRRVLYCHRATTGGIITGSELVEGIDFDVVSGNINWTKGDALGTSPSPGADYTVTYYVNPVYVILSMPHVLRDVQMNQRLAAQTKESATVNLMAALEWIPLQ